MVFLCLVVICKGVVSALVSIVFPLCSLLFEEDDCLGLGLGFCDGTLGLGLGCFFTCPSKKFKLSISTSRSLLCKPISWSNSLVMSHCLGPSTGTSVTLSSSVAILSMASISVSRS